MPPSHRTKASLQTCARARSVRLGEVLEAGADLAHLDGGPGACRTLRGEFDGFVSGRTIHQKITADHLLRFRKRTVPDDAFAAALFDAGALIVATQRVAGNVQAAGFEIVTKAQHGAIGFLAGFK